MDEQLKNGRRKPTFKLNEILLVDEYSPHNQGRVGYFQFEGTGSSKNIAILSDEADGKKKGKPLFSASMEHIIQLEADKEDRLK